MDSTVANFFSMIYTTTYDQLGKSIMNPTWDSPFYTVLAICVVTFSLEVFLPKKKPYKPLERKGFWQDIFYVIFVDFILYAVGFYTILAFLKYLLENWIKTWEVEDPYLFNVGEWPLGAQFLILFLIADFLQFWGHYLLHRVDFLWQFHKIHHAQKTLGFASTRHFHWAELLQDPILYIPFFFIGISADTYFTFELWVTVFFAFLSHSNIKVKWGFLNYLFINPETHFWHHAQNIPKKYGVNFASVLPLWDLLIGSFYLPENEEPELGIPDDNVPETFWGQFLYPFKENLRKWLPEKKETRQEKRLKARKKKG